MTTDTRNIQTYSLVTANGHTVLAQCWPTVCDACPALAQHSVNVWCLARDIIVGLTESHHGPNIVSMLTHRLRRWLKIKTKLVQSISSLVGCVGFRHIPATNGLMTLRFIFLFRNLHAPHS